MASKVRLFVDHPLGEGQSVPLSREQAHYLFGVMRLARGTVLSLINGRDGEWDAEVAEAGKRGGVLICQTQTRLLQMPPDLWLLFAPIRKERTAFIVEKAVELGVARICPVQTAFTQNADRVRTDKLRAHAIEAAEQCGGTFVPTVDEVVKLDKILADWPAARMLMFCDETMASTRENPRLSQFWKGERPGPWAILVGPEGGFSPEEQKKVYEMSRNGLVQHVDLGPRILRADTAVVSALTLWQYELGDWY